MPSPDTSAKLWHCTSCDGLRRLRSQQPMPGDRLYVVLQWIARQPDKIARRPLPASMTGWVCTAGALKAEITAFLAMPEVADVLGPSIRKWRRRRYDPAKEDHAAALITWLFGGKIYRVSPVEPTKGPELDVDLFVFALIQWAKLPEDFA